MNKNIKINKPCPEKWESMDSAEQGKFCKVCSRNIFDFTEKTDEEIIEIIKRNDEQKICGKISLNSFPKIAAIVLMANFTLIQAQVETGFPTSIRHTASDTIRLSGRLLFKETPKQISGATVYFITKNRYLKAVTNGNGYFSLQIPKDLIQDKNVLYLNFDKLNEIEMNTGIKAKDTITAYNYGNQSLIFSRDEKVENKKFQIDYKGYEIGEVVVVKNPPPDYYYYDGKSISEEKFNSLKKKNPKYPYFFFETKEAKIIAEDDFINRLYLLFSK